MVGRALAFGSVLVLASLAPVLPARPGEMDRIVVLLAPSAAGSELVRSTLAAGGWTLEPALTGDARTAVHLAAPRSEPAAPLWDLVAKLVSLRGVRDAGMLLDARRERVSFFSGQVTVAFRNPTDEFAAHRWGAGYGLELGQVLEAPHLFLFRAQASPAALLALAVEARSVADVTPIAQVWIPEDALAVPADAGYHRLPDPRLVVALVPAGVPCGTLLVPAATGTVGPSSPAPGTCVWKADREEDADAALARLRIHPDVLTAGEALSVDPLTLLTDQLVVRFVDAQARVAAAALLDEYDLTKVRALPYGKNTMLFKHPRGGYELYRAARALVLGGSASFAVPNLIIVNDDSCGNNGCVASPESYLAQTHICEPWDWLLKGGGAATTVIGVLDRGIRSPNEPAGLECTRLSVGTAIDFSTMDACQPATASLWCEASCKSVWSSWGAMDHATGVAYIAAATHSAEDDLMGIAPGAPLINARRNHDVSSVDKMSDVALADALWWMAGGAPGWGCDCVNYICPSCPDPTCTPVAACVSAGDFPEPLDDAHRATVLNLSFWRPDFLTSPCTTPGACQVVCANLASCGILDSVLKRVRFPLAGDGVRAEGALVVNAVGIHGLHLSSPADTYCYANGAPPVPAEWDPFTALAESSWTLAAGSVMEGGEPFWRNGEAECMIQFPGSFADVVVPMGGRGGGDASAQLCSACANGNPLHFGESSAAAAAVSGVAALMFQVSPTLTAAQADCILRRTARKLPVWSNPLGKYVQNDCMFSADHSPCFGNGMVDACAAMDMAAACADPTNAACRCLPDGSVPPVGQPGDVEGLVRDDRVSMRWVPHGPRPDWQGVPSSIVEALMCLLDRYCSCPDGLACIRALVVNPSRKTWRDVRAELCVGERCWPQPMKTVRRWKPGKPLNVDLAASLDLKWEAQSTGKPLTLRLSSRGVPIDLDLGSTQATKLP